MTNSSFNLQGRKFLRNYLYASYIAIAANPASCRVCNKIRMKKKGEQLLKRASGTDTHPKNSYCHGALYAEYNQNYFDMSRAAAS